MERNAYNLNQLRIETWINTKDSTRDFNQVMKRFSLKNIYARKKKLRTAHKIVHR